MIKSDLEKDLDFSLGIDIMYSRVKNIDSI